MVVGAIIIGAIIIGGLILATLLASKAQGTDMSPQGLDSFQITSSEEGKVIPLVFGKVRLNTNMLWYGNLKSKEVKEEVGGKGGGSQEQSVGFDYWLDLWQAVCEGPDVTLEGVYIQDDLKGLGELGTYSFNDGDDSYFPSEAGQYAAPLNPVAHIFLDKYYLGLNATMVPTFHFVIEKLGSAPISYANLANGVNPATIIYELFRKAGAGVGDFDNTSLQQAATYWKDKGYGLNIKFSKQEEMRNMINRIFTYVDGAVYFDEDDRIVVKAFRDTDTSITTITEEKFKTFQFTRRTWNDVFTDYRANFIDESQDFTQRTIRVRNPAVHALIGYERQKTVDLTAFRDADTSSKRLWELMKRLSYPEAQVTCKLGIEYNSLNIGDIVTVDNADYGISGMEFRVWEKDASEIDSNEITFRFMQYLENLFDSNYEGGGGSLWTTPTYSPVALAYQRVFELPYTNIYNETPAYLLLGARQGQEDGFVVQYSPTGANYVNQGSFSTFSQRGTLDVTYNPAGAIAIDDEVGILYTPYRDDPEFQTLDRDEFFSVSRFALMGNELVGFQTITPEGVNSFRLGGIIRGVMNTVPASHSAGSEIWICSLGNNVFTGAGVDDFFVKMLPKFGSNVLDPGLAAAIHVVGTAKARTPWDPSRIQVVKTGSSNVVSVWPTSQLFAGGGVESGQIQVDQWPPAMVGELEYYLSVATTIVVETNFEFVVTRAGGFTLYVRQRRSGKTSAWKSVVVGAGDGTYTGPTS
jgi:hypothetical protein